MTDRLPTVAVVGATGRVGREMLSLLAEREFPCQRVRALASARSVGQQLPIGGGVLVVEDLAQAELAGIDLALFSAGGATSKLWAPRFAEQGAWVVDNSSAWRMDPAVPLVVPEVNPHHVTDAQRIIANPNCSTIQLVVVLHAIARRWPLLRVAVATYQSVSGAGEKGVQEYLAQRDEGSDEARVMGAVVHENVVPWIGANAADGYSEEEVKVERETRKIMDLRDLRITCTAVRVPVINAHSEAVTVSLDQAVDLGELREALQDQPGVLVVDDAAARRFPTPREASGRDEVFVGRIRPDHSQPNSWHLWVVADNIRKGAALNAIQIAEQLPW